MSHDRNPKHLLKTLLLFITVSLMIPELQAQAKGKPSGNQPPPSQKELEDLMKQAQQMMKDMDPATKKFMDSMGLKMPADTRVPKLTDAQWKQGKADAEQKVPQKDAARIASMPKQPLTLSTIGPFLTNLRQRIDHAVSPQATKDAEYMFTEMMKAGTPVTDVHLLAAGLWINGFEAQALSLQSRACTAASPDANSLCNFAAMATMEGAPEAAIPILTMLNTQYPGNTTIMNNIGQAWFALGDMQQAEDWLNRTVGIYPRHSMANQTLAYIDESHGDHLNAIRHMRTSLAEGFSEEKAADLEKWGHKVTDQDITWGDIPTEDILGLDKFYPPPIPLDVNQSIAYQPYWKEFREELTQRKSDLRKKWEAANRKWMAKMNELAASGDMIMPSPMAAKASYFLAALDRKQADGIRAGDPAMEYANIMPALANLSASYERKHNDLLQKIEDESGEGKKNRDFCPDLKQLADDFLAAYNAPLVGMYDRTRIDGKKRLNAYAYYSKFVLWPEQYEALELELKLNWLDMLEPPNFEENVEYKCRPSTPKKAKMELPDFDVVNCPINSTFNAIYFTIKQTCNELTGKLELSIPFVPLSIKGSLSADMRTKSNPNALLDHFKKGSFEMLVKASGADAMQIIPLDGKSSILGANVGVSLGGRLEFNGEGRITDAVIKGSVDASVGANIKTSNANISEPKMKAGVGYEISVVTGKAEINGTLGPLKGILK